MTSLATSLQLQKERTNSWYICICCTLRSGLHEIPTMIRTFPHELENNHACKWIFENFPRILTYIYSWKIVLIPFACMVVLHSMWKVIFLLKSMGQICPLDFILFRTCSNGLENNQITKWFSDNFPGIILM